MSRAFKLVVIALIATFYGGCGDKGGDVSDSSDEVSSTSSDSGNDSDESFYDDESSSESDESFYDDNPDNAGDESFYDDNPDNAGDESFYDDNPDNAGDESFYDDNPDNAGDESFYDDNPDNAGDESFYDDNPDNAGDESFYDDNPDNAGDESFYDDNPDNAGDESFYDNNPDNAGDESFYDNDSSGDEDIYGDSPDGRRSKPSPKTYSDQARAAFERGQDDLALKYTYAAVLTDAEAAKSQTLYLWGSKPTMAVRWGIGINYTAPKTLKSRLPMIGDKPPKSATGRKRSRVIGSKRNNDGFDDPEFSGDSGYDDDYGDDDYGDEDYGDPSGGGGKFRLPDDSWGQLTYLTGEVGERFIERLDMRRVRGYYGAVLKGAPKVERRRSGDGYSDDYSGDSYDDYTDDYTDDYSDDSPNGDTYGASSASYQTGPQLIPGATMLGLGDSKELLARAKQRDLDVLLVFEVQYVKSLSGVESNNTTMRLYGVENGKQVAQSPTLNSVRVWNERENLQDDKNDPVELAIDEILSGFADEHVRVKDFPSIDSEKAKARIQTLTDKKASEPLPVLAEIKYYHTKGLITDAELADAYKRVIGDAGLQLASVSLEDQKKALAPYLEAAATEAESLPSDTGVGSGGFR